MITKTKKFITLALTIIVFATVLTAGSLATIADNAFACGSHCGHFGNFGFLNHHGKRSHTHQSISQECDQIQNSRSLSSGAFSPRISSGNNIAACANVNLGGNVAATDQ
jgi:hypothetical protein